MGRALENGHYSLVIENKPRRHAKGREEKTKKSV